MAHLLGIDIGTSSTKSLISTTDGNILATATATHPISMPRPGFSEQNPHDWWNSTCQSVRSVMHKASISPESILAIGLSGQMHGSVFLNKNHEVLHPAILWNDQRTVTECDMIESIAGSKKKLIQAVGNPALPGFTAPKILWFRKHKPDLFEQTAKILLPKDYIRLRMTGTYATEVSDASGTLLFDVNNRKWDHAFMRKLHLDPSLFPDCAESHVVTAELSDTGAKELGLQSGISVVGGAADNAAAAVGNGVVQHGHLCSSIGTSGVMYAHSEVPEVDPHGRVHTMCSAVDGEWCIFGCMLSAGGAFQWFRNQLATFEFEQSKTLNQSIYTLLIEEACKIQPGSEGLFFLPYLAGERCPHMDPDARGCWIGLTQRHTRAHMIRSLLEGVTFGMNDMLQILRNMDISTEIIRLTGGGAKSNLWRQIQADIYNSPVTTINTSEGPAYGAVILAGVGADIWPDIQTACKAIVIEKEKLNPSSDRSVLYARYHNQYTKLYQALSSQFRSIEKI
ncbi:Xylulose kinase [Poriferisphaera corsica]|uniref:Xylulose kinase n=1 Tax=Poriferisphaera corsica TaxID=2528020 RepID=A0A517YSP4_9BACT|nr:xylulokinase [Poriferisphaera corsica]QDU33263.1 Xylulose kinase [Poriferisphaera corsica]